MLFNSKILILLASCFAVALCQDNCSNLVKGQCQKLPDTCVWTGKPEGCVPRSAEGKNTASIQEAPDVADKGICAADVIQPGTGAEAKLWRGKDVCNIWAPGTVVNFHVECKSASYLDFQIADCCIPGDHWQLKGKNWDRAPQTAVTTSPGPPGSFSVPGRVYNYGGTPSNPGSINALVECSYLHGVDVFGAGSYVYFESDAAICTITKVPVDDRIDRMP